MSWIVATSKPNQAKRAEENLINQGLETYFPEIIYPSNGKLITKYLFPGYGFIRMTTAVKLVSINSTKGISSVIRINDLIPKLSDSVIKDLRKQLMNLRSQLSKKRSLKKNDTVIIKLSIFKNQEAEIIDLANRNDSQKVLLKFLHSSQVIWIDSKYLELNLNFRL